MDPEAADEGRSQNGDVFLFLNDCAILAVLVRVFFF